MTDNLRTIIRIVTIYVGVSIIWIILSDDLASYLQRRYGLSEQIETWKGILFVLLTGVLLFGLLKHELKLREEAWMKYLDEKEQLMEQLQQKNLEILQAYDKTIEGWSRVLEMRNREVKDHSRRVTYLTLCLARYLGVSEPDLTHIRRGALLHDIGKMAIADSIMLKDGHLDEEERAVIRKHPIFGFEMLSEIEYLRPAMDILLCHHERWNGEGYPFGLAGEQIPYFARIFSVVDVFDALISDDRPYRRPQAVEEVAEYLRSEAGQQFDPQIVEAFLRMLQENPSLADPKALVIQSFLTRRVA